MAYTLREDEQHLQKKLIPYNIFVCIIALVAALTLLFTPLMTIDVGKLLKIAAEEIENAANDTQNDNKNSVDNVDEENPDGSSDENKGQDFDVMDMLKGIDAKIVISPMSAAKVARAPEDKKAETLFGDIFVETKLLDTLMINAVNTMLATMADTVGDENIAALVDNLKKLDNVKSKADFDKVVNDYLTGLEQIGDEPLSDEDRAAIVDKMGEIYDITVKEADKFSLEAMICVAVSSGILEEQNEDSNVAGGEAAKPRKIVTSYTELLTSIMDGEGESLGDIGESLAEIKDTINTIAGFYGYIFYVVLFFAAMWLILFLSSLLHMLAKNKRFTAWYVKLTGYIPCLIFGVLPVVLKKVIASVLEADAGNLIGAAIGAFSTMTWISGACYIVLWLTSIFWAFPIKRRIRRLRKSGY